MLQCPSTSNGRIFLYSLAVALSIFLGIFCLSRFSRSSHRQSTAIKGGSPIRLQGDKASRFLEREEGQSLGKALNEQRFKISWEEKSPFSDQAGGYLALSHEQNINAWFSDDVVMIRPTGSDLADKWTFGMKLKAFGYADRLQPAPALIQRSASGTRIEYKRESAITEWYENRSAGIEQGFTINQRPQFEGTSEELRLVISISGDVKALRDDSRIKLVDKDGQHILNYGQLSAVDANKKTLPSHLDTNADGNELHLVIDDRDATYPIVVDPITASEQARLIPGAVENGGRIGFSVAIDGDLAILGSPTTDLDPFTADIGRVYVYTRTGTTWANERNFSHPTLASASLRCGYSVDISSSSLVYGCPGFAGTKGSAVVLFRSAPNTYTTTVIDQPQIHPGDRFGAYVAVDKATVLVGAPFYDRNSAQDTNDGAVFLFDVDGTFRILILGDGTPFSNNMFGSDVAIDNNGATLVVGEPLADVSTISDSGAAHIFTLQANGTYAKQTITAPDLAAGDEFGRTVAISANTVVVGSPFDDNQKGTNAGSVYVFRKRNTGIWTQEAKLVASDGFANDEFSYLGLAIKNSTVVVGAHLADGPNFPFDPNENRGEVYIYTTENEVWTEQSRVRASDGSPGDEFGLAVDLDQSSLIVGAPNDDLFFPGLGTLSDAGSAYVYTLSCSTVPAPVIGVSAGNEPELIRTDSVTLCENTRPTLVADVLAAPGQTYQWRRNGVNVPGASASFLFKFFTAADAGSYDVVVSNSCSSRVSAPVVVNVQSGCNVSPLNQTLPSSAGSGALNVTACPTCYWGVTIFLNSSSFGFNLLNFGGRGNGTLDFTVTKNPFTIPRTVEYEVVGKRALITQEPASFLTVINDSLSLNSGSLADALNIANQSPGDDVITFDIPGAGPHNITTSSTLSITSNLKIVNDRVGDESVTLRRNSALGGFRVLEIGPNANVSISGLTISDGMDSVEGSAILNKGGRVSLRNCTITNNKNDSGAAVQNNGGILEVNNCAFLNNTGVFAGAISNMPVNGKAAVTVVNNSTFSGNTGVFGGAVHNGLDGVPGYLTIRNSTFSGNFGTGAGSVNNEGVMTSINTIYRRDGVNPSLRNVGTFRSLGHNLSDDAAGGDGGTGPGGLLNGPGDIRNMNPLLVALNSNGGLTQTFALAPGSPAIEAGDDTVLNTPLDLLTDQRRFFRRIGSHVDIGAFESNSVAGPTVQFSAATYSGAENAGRIDLIISRTGNTAGQTVVNYATSDKGSGNNCDAVSDYASSRCDYLTATGSVRFNAGETSKIVSLLVVDDVIPENIEKLTIELTDIKGALLGAQNTAEIRIDGSETTNPPNPLSQPIFFVREHYLDFLNREPDSSGLNFWTNEINACGSNQGCIEVKRINVSGAFFLSIEFQETGYLVYRCYKAGYGNLSGKPVPIALSDFLRDTQEIGKGVVVGSPGWEAVLESNKQAYALALVNRPEFTAAFGSALTADQFVTQMNNNAGGVLSGTEKANLVALLGSTPFDPVKRAQVLRLVADDTDLRNAEFNKAFVLMQYFGYLRRNPNDFPDTNFDGYNFWLGKLNQFNGNFVNAEMVKAFLAATEYQHRFGP